MHERLIGVMRPIKPNAQRHQDLPLQSPKFEDAMENKLDTKFSMLIKGISIIPEKK